MKRISVVILLMTLFVINIFGQTVDEVFEAHYKAAGGKELWDGVKAYTIKQSYVSNAPSDYDMEVKASIADMSMLKTKTIMKRNFVYGVNPSDAFFRVPMGSRDKAVVYDTKDLSDKEKMNMKREIVDMFAPFYNYQAKGYIATYVGLEVIGAQRLHHIELSGKDIKYDLYFDNITHLLTKQVEKLSTGEEITKEYTTYTTAANGIIYPSFGTYYSSIDKRNVKLTTSIVFNPALDATTFKR
jgi:putative salt-induced outer membrane protein